MERPQKHLLLTGTRITGLGTLASRILGLLRDMATASLLGLSGSAVADAFVIAFRVPNLFRRLFGEGALAASYLPVFTRLHEADPHRAWQLTSVLLTWLSAGLCGLVFLGEALFFLLATCCGNASDLKLLLGLAAVMLPYLWFICLAAQLSATLNALFIFSVPALIPVALNVCWLGAAWFVAPFYSGSQEAQAYVLGGAVLVAGVVQVLIQWPLLRRLGFRFDYDFSAVKRELGEIGRMFAPMVVGLAVTQINTFSDSLIAWGFSSSEGGPQTIAWLGSLRYPMQQGAAASIYYGERMYEFPVGILGMAVATAIFPLLSRHAARGRHKRLGADLTLGLRMIFSLAVPAGVGLILLARPLTDLLFEHGQFTAHDSGRAATMVACYALSVWAYCAVPVLIRGFYALGDSLTPVRVAVGLVGLDLVLNLTLIWPWAEAGLALSTALAAAVQLLTLLAIFVRRVAPLNGKALRATLIRTLAATAMMSAACLATLYFFPASGGWQSEILRVSAPLLVSVAVYTAAFRLLGGKELGMLWTGIEK
ncbi:MAG: murein biosynthesis integral membrane protein MurJ [Pirellulales bacterium]|nr:murein biosynthesis integral membrane protein MurJ [Pirellulales bacterium]